MKGLCGLDGEKKEHNLCIPAHQKKSRSWELKEVFLSVLTAQEVEISFHQSIAVLASAFSRGNKIIFLRKNLIKEDKSSFWFLGSIIAGMGSAEMMKFLNVGSFRFDLQVDSQAKCFKVKWIERSFFLSKQCQTVEASNGRGKKLTVLAECSLLDDLTEERNLRKSIKLSNESMGFLHSMTVFTSKRESILRGECKLRQSFSSYRRSVSNFIHIVFIGCYLFTSHVL